VHLGGLFDISIHYLRQSFHLIIDKTHHIMIMLGQLPFLVCLMLYTTGVIQQIQRDGSLGKVSNAAVIGQSVEILTALRKLGETLTPDEEAFLSANSSASLKEFEQVSGNLGLCCFFFVNLFIQQIVL